MFILIEHIVLFKFSDRTTEAQKEEAARRLRHLIHELPGIIDIQAGQNYSTRSKGYSLGLTVRFPTKADHEHYTPSPEHQAVVSYMKEIGLVDSLAVDFEIPSEK
ncbi:Dabb family protein [Sporolactobacillus sp. Y61]|uniref:Dabb family protein n=1 Tax=Sporolactobacillus sp. Y61 TaxID=3160863 RepID=A0AAU8IGD5_9BACL